MRAYLLTYVLRFYQKVSHCMKDLCREANFKENMHFQDCLLQIGTINNKEDNNAASISMKKVNIMLSRTSIEDFFLHC